MQQWENTIKEIEAHQDDNEVAHLLEDKVRNIFIEELSSGKINNIKEAQEVAKILLKSNSMNFYRWYA